MIVEAIRDQLPEGAIVFNSPEFDYCIVGTTTDGRVVYSYAKMVAQLMSDPGMTMTQAEEWLNKNTVDMLKYLNPAPVIMYEATWPIQYRYSEK